jgi:hypothetical protein
MLSITAKEARIKRLLTPFNQEHFNKFKYSKSKMVELKKLPDEEKYMLISRDFFNGSCFIEGSDYETQDQGRALISDAIELYRSMSKEHQHKLSEIIDTSLKRAG